MTMKHFCRRTIAAIIYIVCCSSHASALMIGKRRIICTQPVGGKADDALMGQKPVIPALTGYAGFQALLPGLGKCPIDVQIQPPWFQGAGGAGFCPPEYWALPAVGVGFGILAAAFALNSYTETNRLLIDNNGIGVVEVEDTGNGSKDNLAVIDKSGMIPFKDITDWKMTPVGLSIETSSSSKEFFFVAWDAKSVEALLQERL
mmetsp:Transcript_26490/g.31245  ORF Transcript_26490/g.31245 Transcript_26490/m.31245 type:complete len:203 (+) Transcript_26490:59-667(+)